MRFNLTGNHYLFFTVVSNRDASFGRRGRHTRPRSARAPQPPLRDAGPSHCREKLACIQVVGAPRPSNQETAGPEPHKRALGRSQKFHSKPTASPARRILDSVIPRTLLQTSKLPRNRHDPPIDSLATWSLHPRQQAARAVHHRACADPFATLTTDRDNTSRIAPHRIASH